VSASFYDGLNGGSQYLADDKTRCRWLVADCFRQIAKEEDRSMKIRIIGMAGSIESGYQPTKKILKAIGPKRIEKAMKLFIEKKLELEKLPA